MSLLDVAAFQEERGKKLSKFMKIKDGESFQGVFIDVVNSESNKYRELDGSMTVNAEFTFKINDEEKRFVLRASSKGTRDLISRMKELQVVAGDVLEIRRQGSGRESAYIVSKLSGNPITIKTEKTDVSTSIEDIFKK